MFPYGRGPLICTNIPVPASLTMPSEYSSYHFIKLPTEIFKVLTPIFQSSHQALFQMCIPASSPILL